MQLGALEQKIMHYLWRFPDDRWWGVRELIAGVPAAPKQSYAYTTILTVMTHLATKKVVDRKRVGRQYVYKVRLSEADVVSRLTHGFLNTLRQQYGAMGLVHFIDTVEEDVDPAVLARAKTKLLRAKD